MVELPVIPCRRLGSQGMMTSAQGLGCMGMTPFRMDAKPEDEMIKLIHHAVDVGVTLFDTSQSYGPYTNEILLGKAIASLPRDKVQIATKFGVIVDSNFTSLSVNGSAEHVRAAAEASLKRLQTEYIDLYYQHRVDASIPIEVTVGEMKRLVEEGKVKYLGLSEASADTIRRAHAVHPITAVQLEWSLWTRDAEEEIVPLCRELGIGIVGYSPLGRGFLSGLGTDLKLNENDYKRDHPRFQQREKNRVFYERLKGIAQRMGVKPGQLALAWVHQRGEDVFPIPGTTSIAHFHDNLGALGLTLSQAQMEEVEAAVPFHQIAGDRYPAAAMRLSWQHATTPPFTTYAART
ncbi:hypothetical protein CBR_g44282 [Chara braunii]|uniref:NADP-dependent oxidoreductase domain-containing protein n=1 Tax=Chara braunii TaxID=69332 RepID=A0A388K2X9_CHABU|nr:hypothetical protein CBR_g44282 [Chara braunii]|eukprot:GBG64398.1 hypothetical protein CBR_g44282 [Chara braunii]